MIYFWNKLNQYGINGNFLHSLQAMYNGFQCVVEVNNKCTPYFSVNCGVKQSCPLSPSLFSQFINDLLVDFNASGLGVDCGGYTNIPVLGYADDTALFAGNPRDLQLLLNKVQTWCTSNGITVNRDKTKIMHFRTKRRAQSKFDFKFNGNSLEYCKEYKYLGLWINEHLDLNLMLERVSLASRRALACLIAKAK